MTHSLILNITEDNPDRKLLERAVAVLMEGGVIAFPTETVYGIGCLLPYKKSIERIYSIKGRDFNKPLAVYLASTDALRAEAPCIAPWVDKLIRKFLPGSLTIILRNKEGVSTGYRISPHKVLLSLLDLLTVPIVGTSANKSGEKDSITAEEVIKSLGGELDLIIDSGVCPERLPSTVVECIEEFPKILREGKISTQEILDILG